MTKIQTLKLGASSIGVAAPRTSRPTVSAPVVEETTAAVVVEEQPTPVAVEVEAPTPALPQKRRVTTKRNVLLALLALAAIATLGAVEATGSIHSGILKFATVVLIAAAGAAVLAGTAIAYSSRRPQSAAPAAAAARKNGFGMSKAILMLLMVLGIVAYFGGAGTFAGFTAETANPNDTLASGTLLLQNQVNANAACHAEAGESNNNVNANCNVALSFGTSSPGQEPGVYVGTATIALTNSGTLPASKLYFWAPWVNGVLASGLTSGTPYSSLTLQASGHGPAGMEGPVAAGDLLVVAYQGFSQTFCASSAAAAGATTINIGSTGACTGYTTTANANYAAGSTVQDQSTNTQIGTSPSTNPNTNCYDTQVTQLGPSGGPYWNSATFDPLCQSALLYIQEVTESAGNITPGVNNYCWFGSGHDDTTTGMCDAPISTHPTGWGAGSQSASASTTVNVAALTGNVKGTAHSPHAGGDVIQFSESGNVVQCTASTDAYIGASSISLSATACTVVSGANGHFDNSAVITDITTLGTLANDYPSAADSIAKFDTTRNYNLKRELTPVTGNGATGVAAVDLASNATRYFIVGVIIPGPAANQNALQGLKSTFGLVWHIDQ